MDLIKPERRIKCRQTGQKKPDADTGNKIIKLLHGYHITCKVKIAYDSRMKQMLANYEQMGLRMES